MGAEYLGFGIENFGYLQRRPESPVEEDRSKAK